MDDGGAVNDDLSLSMNDLASLVVLARTPEPAHWVDREAFVGDLESGYAKTLAAHIFDRTEDGAMLEWIYEAAGVRGR